jgi:hypothetical protein
LGLRFLLSTNRHTYDLWSTPTNGTGHEGYHSSRKKGVCSGKRDNWIGRVPKSCRAYNIVVRVPSPENAGCSKRSILVPWPYFDENNCSHSIILEIDAGLLPRFAGQNVRHFNLHDDHPRRVVPIRKRQECQH